MLHTRARAHRSATTLLSFTLDDTLPKWKAFYRYEVAPSHWIIVIRDQIEYGDLARAYARRLPLWARVRAWPSVGVADPAEDLSSYHRTRWWNESWQVGPAAVHLLEEVAPGVTPWRHEWLLDPPA